MRRAVFGSLTLLVFAACSDTVIDAPTAAPPTTTPVAMPPVVEPPAAPPTVWGTTVLEDTNPAHDIVEVYLFAYPTQVVLQDGTSVEMLTYNGQFPGPMLRAKVGDEVIVHFDNQLSQSTTIHWHGLRISDQMDGNPRIQDPVQPGATFTYRFKVEEAGSFWYHPHVRAHEQVERGLYGALVVHDLEVDPEYDQERYLVLDDILLNGDVIAPPLRSHPEQIHGRFGNVLLTNGSADLVTTEARPGAVERWRIVNTANARTMSLRVVGATARVIGVDGGLLRRPYAAGRLELPVGARYDLEVRIDAATPAVLEQLVITQNGQGELVEVNIPVLEVTPAGDALPAREIAWPAMAQRIDRAADREFRIEFSGVNSASGVQWQLNGNRHGDQPILTAKRGETVKLILANLDGPEHPFHLHGQFFEILEFDYPSEVQPGLRDTVLIPGQRTVEILAYFDNPGRWMAHCHILEHAELGMMSEIVVE